MKQPEPSRTTETAGPRWLKRVVRPRVNRFNDDFWFILPALAVTVGFGTFRIAGGWLKWHIEIEWS